MEWSIAALTAVATAVGVLQWWSHRGDQKRGRTAAVSHRYYSGGHGVQLFRTRNSDTGALMVTVSNEGPAVARRVRMRALFRDDRVREAGLRWAIGPESEYQFMIDLTPAGFLVPGETPFSLALEWEDGNGRHEIQTELRMAGPWPDDPHIVEDVEAT